jgi:hypothetical protein
MALQQATIQYINSCYSHYYICKYLPVSAGRDTLSYSLLRFKRGLQPDLSGWIDCSLEILAAGLPPGNHLATGDPQSPISTILPAGQCPISLNSTIIRALHYNETSASPDGTTALDRLGRALAARFECRYSPGLLRKSRVTREIKGMTRQQREAELADLYYIDPSAPGAPCPPAIPSATDAPDAPAVSPDPPQGQTAPYYNGVASDHQPDTHPGSSAPALTPPSFLIIDDVLTTATTIKMIIGAIGRHYPHSPLQLFTLARADYDASLNKPATLRGQNYRLEEGTDWLVAEENSCYYSAWELKNWIHSGAF